MDTDMIKKYASGTPKPFAVPVVKKIATEQDAAKFVTTCGDRKAVATKVEGGYTIQYRRWFDTFEAAQAFVASMVTRKEAKVKEEKEHAEFQTKCASVKKDLQAMLTLMESRGKTDLVEKTKALISKL